MHRRAGVKPRAFVSQRLEIFKVPKGKEAL